jgi:hypothetical protein
MRQDIKKNLYICGQVNWYTKAFHSIGRMYILRMFYLFFYYERSFFLGNEDFLKLQIVAFFSSRNINPLLLLSCYHRASM